MAGAGCGSEKDTQGSASTPAATPSPTARPKPKVRVPTGKSPKHQVVRDLRVGTGAVARTGSTVTVHYVGVIPPALGYGAQGQPPVIKPNEMLVFVIDLLDVQ